MQHRSEKDASRKLSEQDSTIDSYITSIIVATVRTEELNFAIGQDSVAIRRVSPMPRTTKGGRKKSATSAMKSRQGGKIYHLPAGRASPREVSGVKLRSTDTMLIDVYDTAKMPRDNAHTALTPCAVFRKYIYATVNRVLFVDVWVTRVLQLS